MILFIRRFGWAEQVLLMTFYELYHAAMDSRAVQLRSCEQSPPEAIPLFIPAKDSTASYMHWCYDVGR